MNYFVPLIIFTPLLMSIILMSPVISDNEKIIRRSAKGFALLHFTFCVIFSAFFNFAQSDFVIETSYKWIDVLGINADFSIDSLSLLLIILTSFIFLISIYISKGMIKKSYRLYYSLILFLMTAVIGIFSAKDIFMFFMFWELELIPMYLLILKWGSGNKQKTAMKFLLYTFFGSIFILTAFLIIYFINLRLNGVLSSEISDIDITNAPEQIRNLVFILLFIGFSVKLPVFPLHGWLSDTHSQAPAPVSVILSSILLKLGSYGILKFNFQMFNYEFKLFASVIMLFAVINIIYASVCAIVQKDLKRIIAYSGIANMGIFLLGTASINNTGVTGAIFQIFSHALISMGLFIIAGIIYAKCGTKNILRINGLGSKMPCLMFVSVPILLASTGIPFLCGFPAEFLSFTGAFLLQTESGLLNAKIMTIFALSVLVLSSLYILKIFHGVFFCGLPDKIQQCAALSSSQNLKYRNISDINTKQLIILLLIVLTIIALGIFPQTLINIISQYSDYTYSLQGVF